jgi:hypothetical protein
MRLTLMPAAAGGQAQVGGGGEIGPIAARFPWLVAGADGHVAQRERSVVAAARLGELADHGQGDVGGQVVPHAVVGRQGIGDDVGRNVFDFEQRQSFGRDVGHQFFLADVAVVQVIGELRFAFSDQGILLVDRGQGFLEQGALVAFAFFPGQRIACGGGTVICRAFLCAGGAVHQQGGGKQEWQVLMFHSRFLIDGASMCGPGLN